MQDAGDTSQDGVVSDTELSGLLTPNDNTDPPEPPPAVKSISPACGCKSSTKS